MTAAAVVRYPSAGEVVSELLSVEIDDKVPWEISSVSCEVVIDVAEEDWEIDDVTMELLCDNALVK